MHVLLSKSGQVKWPTRLVMPRHPCRLRNDCGVQRIGLVEPSMHAFEIACILLLSNAPKLCPPYPIMLSKSSMVPVSILLQI